PDPIPPNWGGPGSIIGAWSGGAYDWERDRLIVWGGGHADYSGNEIYVFDLNTLSWSRIWGPTPNEQIPDDGQTYEVYQDGNPSSRHTYEGLEYIPSPIDRFWSQGGSCWKGGGGSNATWLFDFDSLNWERATDSPDSMYGVVSAWDPQSGHVFHQGQNDFSQYDPVADSYFVRGNYSEGWWNDKMTAEIEPNARLFIAIGQEQVNVWTLDTFERQNPTTSGGDNVVNANSPGFVWDSQKQRLVAWVGGTSVWHLDVGDWSWTEEPASGDNVIYPTAPDSKGCYGRFRYVDKYHAVIVVNSIDENVFIYKLRDDI
ncbi:MAG: hypothetical protein JRJ87_12650, partial [Deltaproteobacteria bacterium]|nr:hypothetical protein [Deltaproteobacteria bacterium]